MDKDQLAQLRAKLEQRRAELISLQQEREDSAATVTLDQSSVGRLSRMDALQRQAVAQDNQRRAAVALSSIAAALKRMADGSYGWCADCEEDIDPRRLSFDPATPYCIECAQKRTAR